MFFVLTLLPFCAIRRMKKFVSGKTKIKFFRETMFSAEKCYISVLFKWKGDFFMKHSKKFISVLVVCVMLITSFSAPFSVFAASGVTEEQWNTLVSALKSETVADANFTGSQNSYTVSDPDGDVLAAADAFYAVFAGLYDREGNQENGNRTINLVKDQILNGVNARMNASDFAVYNVANVLNGFIAGANVSSSTDSKNELAAVPNTVLTVNLEDSAILRYDSIADMPDQIVTSRTYTTAHTVKSYDVTSGSGCSSTTTTYYYYTISSFGTSDSSMPKTTLSEFRDYLDTNAAIFGYDTDALIALGSDAIQNHILQLTNGYTSMNNQLGSAVYAKFFGNDYDVPGMTAKLNTAQDIITYLPVSEEIEALASTDYTQLSTTEIRALYTEISQKVNAYDGADAEAKAYIEAKGFDIAAVRVYMEDLLNEVEIQELTALKEKLDGNIPVYEAYNEDDVISGATLKAELELALADLDAFKAALNSYKAENVEKVIGGEYLAEVTALRTEIQRLLNIDGYNSRFKDKYQYYLETVYAATSPDASSSDIIAGLKDYDEWYKGLEALAAEIEAVLGSETADKILTTLNDEMLAHREECYNILGGRFENQVALAADLFDQCKVDGAKVDITTIDTYKALRKSLDLIEKEIYDFLTGNGEYTFSQTTLDDYARIYEDIYADYLAFTATGGFDRYETAVIDDIVREPSDSDIVRDKDYVVTDEKVEEIIKLLDKTLGSEEFNALTGVDLEDTITGVLDNLYTDSFINTVVQYIYPIVANEFVKVWATLPESITIEDVDTGLLGLKADVECDLSLYSVEDAMKAIGLYLFPTTLAENIQDQYPQVAEVLSKATSAATTENNPWEDPAICDEDGNLALNWGVTDRESFVDAAVAALSGLEPLLLALLSNREMNLSNKIGTGSGSAKVSIITLNLTVDPIDLVLTASANPGYNNAVAPILEALGLTAPDGNTFASTRDILEKGLLDPITELLETLASAPVETVAKILPNIAYAATVGLIEPLLGMLKTNINYTTNAKYDAQVTSGTLNDVYKSEEPIAINLADMIDLSSLGVDISSFDAIVDLVEGLLGFELPEIDNGKAASLGTLTWKDTVRSEKTYNYGEAGKAAFIEANKADVLLFVLDYAINALSQEGFIDEIAGAFGAETPVELPDIVNQIIYNVTVNGDNAIAAVAELVFPQDYTEPEKDINWLKTSGETGSAVVYSEYWTKEKANYVAENLPSFVDNIISIFGVKVNGVKVKTLSELVDGYIGNLYSADTLNSLAKTIGDALGSAGLPRGLTDILKDQLGIDLAYWNNWTAEFETGDKDAFVNALADLLKPFTAVLELVLNGKDLSITVTDENGTAKLVTLQGYDGYTNGLIPLLEALGAENVVAPAEFAADSDNIIKNIITPVLSVVDKVSADPYDAVMELLPNILYFAASGGLQVSLDNILYSVYTVIDTIRPIYDLNLTELLGFDLRFTDADPVEYILSVVNGLIYDATGADFKIDFTGEELLSQLPVSDVQAFTSANGKTAYRIVPTENYFADVLTVVLRYAVGDVLFSENAVILADLVKDNFDISEEAYAFIYSLLSSLAKLDGDAVDMTLGAAFFVFYGADNAVDAYIRYFNYDWEQIIADMNNSQVPYLQRLCGLMGEVYETTFKNLFDDISDAFDLPVDSEYVEGIAGTFKRILDAFKEFFETLKRFFEQVFAI